MVKKSKKRLVRVALFIGPEQRDKLQALSQATRVPWAAYVREAIDDLLVKYKRRNQP